MLSVAFAFPSLSYASSGGFTFTRNYCVFGASCTTPSNIHQSGIGSGNLVFIWTEDIVTITDSSTPLEFYDIWNVTDENNIAIAGYAQDNQPQDFSTLPNGKYWVVDEYAGAGNNDCVNHYGTTNFTTCWQTAQTNAVVKFEKISAGNYQEADVTSSPPPTQIIGSGTINRLAKFITGTSIGDSLFYDDGSNTTLTSGNLFLQIGALIDSVTNGVLNFGTTQATTMNFGRSGQNMIINSKVGVGTSAPTAMLHVNGDFFADLINITANGLGLDTLTPGTLSIGSTTASTVKIGRETTTTTFPGTISLGKATTVSNCNSTTTPASCGSAPAGSVALPTGGSTLVVNTTAVTTNSQIFITEDSSLDSRLGITCNTGTNRNYSVNARSDGTSFTIKSSVRPFINKACLSYWIVN